MTLGVILFFQVRSSLALQHIKQEQLETQLSEDAVALCNKINAELFMPTPNFSELSDSIKKDFDIALKTQILQWRKNVKYPHLLISLYLYQEETNALYQWENNDIVKAPEAAYQYTEFANPFPNYVMLQNSNILLTDSIQLPQINSRIYLIYIINSSILFNQLVPELTKTSLKNPNSYYLRIRDTQSDEIFYQNHFAENCYHFEKPDIMWPLFPFGSMGIGNYSSIENFKDYKKISNSEAANYNIITVRPVFNKNIMLEIVHKDGSLFKASMNSMKWNVASIALLFLIIVFSLLILFHNIQNVSETAQKQSDFIATITHELKTPIAVISAASQNLSAGIIKDEAKIIQYGDLIGKSAIRLKTAIDCYLTYSRISNSNQIVLKEINYIELINSVINTHKQHFIDEKFSVEIDLPAEPVFIKGDYPAIYSVVENLITNALKHAKSGLYVGVKLTIEKAPVKINHLRLNSKESDKVAILRIIDHGEGIPKNEQKVIFEAFARGKKALSEQIEGSGVGLNLVRRIVTLHGGLITLELSNQQQTVFTVVLPTKTTDSVDANGGLHHE